MVDLVLLGKDKMGRNVFQGDAVLNPHIGIFGKSGSGKSTVEMAILKSMYEQSKKIVVLNWHRCLSEDSIVSEFREWYLQTRTQIDVRKNGLALPLFSKLENDMGDVETDEMVICRVANSLCKLVKLRQAASRELGQAVRTVYWQNLYSNEGIKSIDSYLSVQTRATAGTAKQAIAPISSSNCFRDGDFLEETEGNLIEINLNGFDPDAQTYIAEIIMDMLMRLANTGRFVKENIVVAIDECQNLNFTAGSTMAALMNESRKMGLGLMLVAPRLLTDRMHDMSVIQQAGTKLFFSPVEEDRKKIAHAISPGAVGEQLFNLSRLKIGEFMAVGEFIVADKKKSGPIKLQTALKMIESKGHTPSKTA